MFGEVLNYILLQHSLVCFLVCGSVSMAEFLQESLDDVHHPRSETKSICVSYLLFGILYHWTIKNSPRLKNSMVGNLKKFI